LSENVTGRLCAVTFTRDAAASLKERILEMCGEQVASRLAVGTFHSIALNQLKRAGLLKKRLLGEGERLALLRRCYRQYKCGASFEKVVAAIDSTKSKLKGGLFGDIGLEDVFNAYEEVLNSEQAMDFADILLMATKGIMQQTIPPMAVRWLLVDEAQDMDEVQCEWVMQHGKHGIEVTIVGDDDQSLYTFRHAMGYAGMMRVSEALVCQEITLPINYRCAPNILEHSAILIGLNGNRAHKSIQAARRGDGVIGLHRAADRFHEAETIRDAIKADGNPGGWAVLARSNSLLEHIEALLDSSEIPYTISGGKSVWDGVVGSAFVGLIRSIERDDLTGIANALSVCGIRPHLINQASGEGAANCQSMIDFVYSQVSEEDKPARMAIRSLQKGRIDWSAQAGNGNVSLAIYAAANWLASHMKATKAGNSHAKLIGSLANALSKLKGSIAQRLNTITRKRRDASSGSVSLLTIHSSKGLEFDNVWILGTEDTNIPHPDSTEEDERRLFYVGMTRARNRLEISSSIEDGLETRFIEEAKLHGQPPSCLKA